MRRNSGKPSGGWRTTLVTLGVVLIIALMWFSDEDEEPEITVVNHGQSQQQSGGQSSYSHQSPSGGHQSSSGYSGSQQGSSGYPSGSQQGSSGYSSGSQSGVSTVSREETETYTVDDIIREPLVKRKGDGSDTVTVLVYMNGSDLESQDGEATADLGEMVAAGSSDRVRVVVETLGTKRWKSTYGISSKTAQRYEVSGSGLRKVADNLGNLNVGKSEPLTDFIKWGVQTYPADRYILLFWNHGGGPVYGFGYDDRTGSDDSLTTDEMQTALKKAGQVFDFIGMDCCIMSSMELCCAMYEFCDYMVLSEDFESGYGWYYTDWLKQLYRDPSVSTAELGKTIVNTTVSTTASHRQDSILALIDEAYMKILYSGWQEFAYANEQTLLGTNYSRQKSRPRGGRVNPILEEKGVVKSKPYGNSTTMSSYYVTDIMSVAQNVRSAKSDALSAALSKAVVHMSAYGSSSSLTGLSVTLPYGDSSFYKEMKSVFVKCGFDADYVKWLEKFVSTRGSSDYYDYQEWDSSWGGWETYDDTYDWDDWITEMLGGYFDEGSYGDWDGYGDGWGDWGWSGFGW